MEVFSHSNLHSLFTSWFCCNCRREGADTGDVIVSSSVLTDPLKEEVLQLHLEKEHTRGVVEETESDFGDESGVSTIAAELVSNAADAATGDSSAASNAVKELKNADAGRIYLVALKRSSGRSLGLSFRAPDLQQFLLVDGIDFEDTEIASWNERHAGGDLVIERDHCVLKVGGREQPPSQMLHEISHGMEALYLTMVVPERISATLLKSRGARLGLNVVQCGQLLVVEEVLEGLVRNWNVAHPEQEVRAGDCIVEVCGQRGEPDALMASLQNEFALVIRFIRLTL